MQLVLRRREINSRLKFKTYQYNSVVIISTSLGVELLSNMVQMDATTIAYWLTITNSSEVFLHTRAIMEKTVSRGEGEETRSECG